MKYIQTCRECSAYAKNAANQEKSYNIPVNRHTRKWWEKLHPMNPVWFLMESRDFMCGYPWYKVYPRMPFVYVRYLLSWFKKD